MHWINIQNNVIVFHSYSHNKHALQNKILDWLSNCVLIYILSGLNCIYRSNLNSFSMIFKTCHRFWFFLQNYFQRKCKLRKKKLKKNQWSHWRAISKDGSSQNCVVTYKDKNLAITSINSDLLQNIWHTNVTCKMLYFKSILTDIDNIESVKELYLLVLLKPKLLKMKFKLFGCFTNQFWFSFLTVSKITNFCFLLDF